MNSAQTYLKQRTLLLKNKIKAARQRANLSQDRVSEILGCPPSYVADVEDINTATMFSSPQIELFSKLAGIDPNQFLFLDEESVFNLSWVDSEEAEAALINQISCELPDDVSLFLQHTNYAAPRIKHGHSLIASIVDDNIDRDEVFDSHDDIENYPFNLLVWSIETGELIRRFSMPGLIDFHILASDLILMELRVDTFHHKYWLVKFDQDHLEERILFEVKSNLPPRIATKYAKLGMYIPGDELVHLWNCKFDNPHVEAKFEIMSHVFDDPSITTPRKPHILNNKSNYALLDLFNHYPDFGADLPLRSYKLFEYGLRGLMIGDHFKNGYWIFDSSRAVRVDPPDNASDYQADVDEYDPNGNYIQPSRYTLGCDILGNSLSTDFSSHTKITVLDLHLDLQARFNKHLNRKKG